MLFPYNYSVCHLICTKWHQQSWAKNDDFLLNETNSFWIIYDVTVSYRLIYFNTLSLTTTTVYSVLLRTSSPKLQKMWNWLTSWNSTMKRAISKKGQMYEKGEFLLINMMPCKWQQAWDNFTIFSNVELRIIYCNLISRKQWLFWKNLQCFLVTLSFNMSTLIKREFLKKTATTFYHYSGLTAGSITLLNIISS